MNKPLYDVPRLKKAQEVNLKLLLEVDRICRDHDIKYMMDSGTLLGACRHGGFVPWDDDVDIAMTRDNLDKFLKVAPRELGGDFRLIMPYEYHEGNIFFDFTPRIIYLRSRRNGPFARSYSNFAGSGESGYYEKNLDHLWLDIFILDNIPDFKMADWFIRFCQKVIYGLSMSKRSFLDMKKYSFADRIRVAVLSFMGKFVKMSFLFKLQDRLSRKYDSVPTHNLYYSNYQPDFLYVTIKREWAYELTEIPFEGHNLMASRAYKEILHEVYGNYMELPPQDKRVPSHSDFTEVF